MAGRSEAVERRWALGGVTVGAGGELARSAESNSAKARGGFRDAPEQGYKRGGQAVLVQGEGRPLAPGAPTGATQLWLACVGSFCVPSRQAHFLVAKRHQQHLPRDRTLLVPARVADRTGSGRSGAGRRRVGALSLRRRVGSLRAPPAGALDSVKRREQDLAVRRFGASAAGSRQGRAAARHKRAGGVVGGGRHGGRRAAARAASNEQQQQQREQQCAVQHPTHTFLKASCHCSSGTQSTLHAERGGEQRAGRLGWAHACGAQDGRLRGPPAAASAWL